MAPFFALSARLTPRTSIGRRQAEHELHIENGGNTSLRARIEAEDPDRRLNFAARPDTLDPPPGQPGTARLLVRPRRVPWWGHPETLPFRVRATAEGLPAAQADGWMTVRPLLPRWVARVVGSLLLLLAAAIALVVVDVSRSRASR